VVRMFLVAREKTGSAAVDAFLGFLGFPDYADVCGLGTRATGAAVRTEYSRLGLECWTRSSVKFSLEMPDNTTPR
jgi:hypothetical protein